MKAGHWIDSWTHPSVKNSWRFFRLFGETYFFQSIICFLFSCFVIIVASPVLPYNILIDWWLICFTSKILRFGLPFLLRWRENAAWRILSTHLTGALASWKTGGATLRQKTWHKTGESIILDNNSETVIDVCLSKQGEILEDVICDMCCTWTLMDSSKPHFQRKQSVSEESVDKEYISCIYIIYILHLIQYI